jgi:hypothetical protein
MTTPREDHPMTRTHKTRAMDPDRPQRPSGEPCRTAADDLCEYEDGDEWPWTRCPTHRHTSGPGILADEPAPVPLPPGVVRDGNGWTLPKGEPWPFAPEWEIDFNGAGWIRLASTEKTGRVAHFDTPVRPADTPEPWKCKRCGSDRWVRASLTGPVSHGGKAIRQCVPCGHYSNVPADTPEPYPAMGVSNTGFDEVGTARRKALIDNPGSTLPPGEVAVPAEPARSDLRAASFALADTLAAYDASDGESRPMHTVYLVAAARQFLHLFAQADQDHEAPAEPTRPFWTEDDGVPVLAIPGESYRYFDLPDVASVALLDLIQANRPVPAEPTAEHECRYREHSVTLNSVGWRLARLLGDAQPGDTRVHADVDDLVARVEALVEDTPEQFDDMLRAYVVVSTGETYDDDSDPIVEADHLGYSVDVMRAGLTAALAARRALTETEADQ